MKLPVSRAVLVLLMSLSCIGFGETPPVVEGLIGELRTVLQKEVKEARGNDRGIDRQWQLLSLLLQVEQAFDEESSSYGGDWRQALAAIQSAATSETAQQLAQAIATEAGREFAKREKAAVDEIAAAIERNVAAALDATSAAQVDEPLTALAQVTEESRYRRSSRALEGAMQRLNSAVEFLKRWQDYLSAKDAGRTEPMAAALRNLTNSGREHSFMPRSKLLALQNALVPERESASKPPSLPDLLAGIKTLDDLVAARAQLGRMTLDGTDQAKLVTALRSLADTYLQFKMGHLAALSVASLDSLNGPEIAHLSQQFFAYALPRVLAIEDKTLEVTAGETPSRYLARILSHAQKSGDWALVGRVLAAGRTLRVFDSTTATRDSAALNHFLTGQNQERARQYAFAVVSYQAALKTGSEIVPPEVIGERLEKLRSEQPQDFEKGLQIALAAPPEPSADPRLMRMGAGSTSTTIERFSTGQRYNVGPDGRLVPVEAGVLSIPPKATAIPAPGK